jgi:hypothetical protein
MLITLRLEDVRPPIVVCLSGRLAATEEGADVWRTGQLHGVAEREDLVLLEHDDWVQ